MSHTLWPHHHVVGLQALQQLSSQSRSGSANRLRNVAKVSCGPHGAPCCSKAPVVFYTW
jgi:hypothetical protein